MPSIETTLVASLLAYQQERITECVCLNSFLEQFLYLPCERDAGNIIRIISARKATKNERKHMREVANERRI